MLKKIVGIIFIFAFGGWALSRYIERTTVSTTGDTSYKVFSRVVTFSSNKKTPISAADIIEATNRERVAVGLSPLSTNTKLASSAELKVDDMIDRQYFEHQSPTGEGVSDLGEKVGYEYVILGENLALGSFGTSDEIVEAWMNSPGHKANILNKKYQDIGVSVKQGLYEGKEVWFAVQHFGTSRSVCPVIDSWLKGEIDVLNTQLKEQEKGITDLKKILESPGAQSQPSYEISIQNFNTTVDAYNVKLALSRKKIDQYNQEVRKFNTCIATFQ